MEQNHSSASTQAAQSEAQEMDSPSDSELCSRYCLAINNLVEDALKRGKHRVIVDALTWHLARFIASQGAVAAGHILEQLGRHASYITQRAQAQSEAEQARQEGRKPS